MTPITDIPAGKLVTIDEDGEALTWPCDSYLATPDGHVRIFRLGEIVMHLGPDDYQQIKWIYDA